MSRPSKLIVLSAQHRGLQFELTNDLYTLGRGKDRDICIPDSTISTHHCDIIRSGDRFIIRDNNSTNGTTLNNDRLEPGQEYPLSNSDLIRAGKVELIFDSPEKQDYTSTRNTITVINISQSNPSQTQMLRNAALNTAEQKAKKSKTPIIILQAVLGIIGLAVVATLVAVIIQFFK